MAKGLLLNFISIKQKLPFPLLERGNKVLLATSHIFMPIGEHWKRENNGGKKP